MMKTESGLTHYSQHTHHSSVLAAPSPKIKEERNMPIATGNTTPTIPEPSPFGIVAATTPTGTTAAYTDMHSGMQMRLLTPCSDSDGIIQGFIPHSPAGSDLLYHNHPHQPHHHHSVMGAGSPPTSASSPYDLSHCCDPTTITPGGSPWHSQQQRPPHHHQHSQVHHHPHQHPSSQNHPGSVYHSATGFGGGYALGGGYTTTTAAAAFCGEHPHAHHHLHHEEDGHHMPDELGFHGGAGAATSMFRERELELQMGGGPSLGDSQAVKHEEWETEGYDGI